VPIDPRQYHSAINYISDDKEYSKLVNNISNRDDQLRLKAYELYTDMYHNRPEHIRVTLRGEDDDSVEIYMPSAKKCIEAVNRFLAIDLDYQIDPDYSDYNSQSAAEDALSKVFKDQDIHIKFDNMKRYLLIKGDALLHIRAVPWERPGKRIKVDELLAENYFPIENSVTGIALGCHIIDVIRNPRNSPRTQAESDEWIVRRQTYRMLTDENGIPTPSPEGSFVTSELSLWKINRWDDRIPDPDLYQIEVIQPETSLPSFITQIPVYHWKNSPPPNSTFGMSELSGVESIINAINQSATDEDLTLITQGLGVYWTDASPPIDDNGDEVEWEIGPGAVVQIGAGGNFGRVTGVSSVAPYHEHIKMLDEGMQQAIGVPDIAIGMVDVATAESGIALQLKFGPLLAKCKEKERLIKDVTDTFLYDLISWLIQYEGLVPTAQMCYITSMFADPMPRNKTEDLTNVLSIWAQAPGVLPVSWLYDQLNEIMGYQLDESADFDQAIEDAKRVAESTMPADPFAAQMASEEPIQDSTGFGSQNGQASYNFS
jgi:hypothetical protein